jgi:ADP-ribosyl-[dinitrogen reductase] hydrolase
LAGVELAERIRGCLLAGAVGDALGAPVEFQSWAEIREKFGPDGVTDLGHPARFTDDTQMTLFTAEGLIRARVRGRAKGISHAPSVVRHAYLRWLHTQGVPWQQAGAEFAAGRSRPDGWLVSELVLHRQMAPGNTCLSALRAGGSGTISHPANNSKGCGAVMRAAPVGFCYPTASETWDAACDIAAITHGHPEGIQPAAALAVAIRLLADGEPVAGALECAATLAPAGSNTRRAIAHAIELAAAGLPDPVTLNQRLGQGWTGEEALAIAACCALAAPTPKAALLAAVNHSGDSDSTGSITGNLLGAVHGPQAVPEGWFGALDGADVVTRVAMDLGTELTDPPWHDDHSVPADWWDRYPGW